MTYGPHTSADREQMLAALGIDSIDALFADIPAAVQAHGLDLPPPDDELTLARKLETLAARNRVGLASFLGAGAYRHHIPPTVDQLADPEGLGWLADGARRRDQPAALGADVG